MIINHLQILRTPTSRDVTTARYKYLTGYVILIHKHLAIFLNEVLCLG